MPKTWQCTKCGWEHAKAHSHCAWCKLNDHLVKTAAADAKAMATAAADVKAKAKAKASSASPVQPSTSATKERKKSRGKKTGASTVTTAASAHAAPAAAPPPSGSSSTVTQPTTDPPAETEEMILARQQLDTATALLNSLKGLDSPPAVAQKEFLTDQVKQLHHSISSMKAPKDRVPGLKRGVKVRETALQVALDSHAAAVITAQEAQNMVVTAETAVISARANLLDLQGKLAAAESELAALDSSSNSTSRTGREIVTAIDSADLPSVCDA